MQPTTCCLCCSSDCYCCWTFSYTVFGFIPNKESVVYTLSKFFFFSIFRRKKGISYGMLFVVFFSVVSFIFYTRWKKLTNTSIMCLPWSLINNFIMTTLMSIYGYLPQKKHFSIFLGVGRYSMRPHPSLKASFLMTCY